MGARLPASVDGVCHRGQLDINVGLHVTTSGQPHRAPCPAAVAAAARRTRAAPPHPLCWRLQSAPPARRASRAGRQTATRAARVTRPAADPTSGLRCETICSLWLVSLSAGCCVAQRLRTCAFHSTRIADELFHIADGGNTDKQCSGCHRPFVQEQQNIFCRDDVAPLLPRPPPIIDGGKEARPCTLAKIEALRSEPRRLLPPLLGGDDGRPPCSDSTSSCSLRST